MHELLFPKNEYHYGCVKLSLPPMTMAIAKLFPPVAYNYTYLCYSLSPLHYVWGDISVNLSINMSTSSNGTHMT